MTLKQLTWKDFEKFDPCYDPKEKYGDFKGTILDILKDKKIPDDDKIRAATREDILNENILQIFACKCVREIWHLLTDERSRNAVEVAEKFAVGEVTHEELAAAWDAAMDAAWAAAWDAAWAAARDAAWAAARAKQVQILIELIEEEVRVIREGEC